MSRLFGRPGHNLSDNCVGVRLTIRRRQGLRDACGHLLVHAGEKPIISKKAVDVWLEGIQELESVDGRTFEWGDVNGNDPAS